MTPFNFMQLDSIGAMVAITTVAWSGRYDLPPGMWAGIGWLGAMLPLTLGHIQTAGN